MNERIYEGGTITEPGIYRGVPIEEYHRNTKLFPGFSMSSSGLRQIIRRPLEYWFSSPYNPKAEEPETKRELEFGKAAHMLLLGESGFSEKYALRPEHRPDDMDKPVKDRRKWSGNANDCKEWLKEQEDAGRTIITDTEIGHIRHMADALAKNEIIGQGALAGKIERTLVAKFGDIWGKARPDALPDTGGDVVDLKTAQSVDDDSLERAIYNHGYHVQAGFMRMVFREVMGADSFSSFSFVFVEKGPPYDVRVKTLKDRDIDLGERQARMGLSILGECLKRNEWPGFDGFGQHAGWIEMPSWAKTRIENELTIAGMAA